MTTSDYTPVGQAKAITELLTLVFGLLHHDSGQFFGFRFLKGGLLDWIATVRSRRRSPKPPNAVSEIPLYCLYTIGYGVGMVCRGGIGGGFRAAGGRTRKNLPFLDRKKKRFQLKSDSIFNANNPYMVVASLHFVLRINSPRSLSLHRSRGGVVENGNAPVPGGGGEHRFAPSSL